MDTVENMKTFVAVVEAGSFSAASRRLGIATSVITKRVDQLEWRTGVRLFERSTRRLSLTAGGYRLLPEARRLVREVDDALAGAAGIAQPLKGQLRVKTPTSLTIACLGELIGQFQERYPFIDMVVVVTDRTVNPLFDGFDVAIAMSPATFEGVTDVGLCPLERVVVASPAYLAAYGVPETPTDLRRHRLLNFEPTGLVWTFAGDKGPIALAVTPRLSTNDGHVLLNAALRGNGIALLSSYIVHAALRSGTLVRMLVDFPVPQYWIRASVPTGRRHHGPVQAFLTFLEDAFVPLPPWERAET